MNKAKLYQSQILKELLDEITPSEYERTRKRMSLAVKIARGMEAKGWKKKDFANALKKRPSEITKWLSGTHNFNLDTLLSIEEVLSINLVAVDDTPREQIVKYHVMIVSGNIIMPENPTYIENQIADTLIDLYRGQQLSVPSGKSSKNSYCKC